MRSFFYISLLIFITLMPILPVLIGFLVLPGYIVVLAWGGGNPIVGLLMLGIAPALFIIASMRLGKISLRLYKENNEKLNYINIKDFIKLFLEYIRPDIGYRSLGIRIATIIFFLLIIPLTIVLLEMYFPNNKLGEWFSNYYNSLLLLIIISGFVVKKIITLHRNK